MKTKLQVTVPGEPDRHYSVDTRAIVGKGPAADVSLDHAGVSQQHFRIKLGANNLDVRIAPGAAPLTYEGRPFAGGELPYGTDFYLARIRFSCLPPGKGTNSRVIPLLIACVVVIGGFTALSMFDQSAIQSVAGADDVEVTLFEEPAPCPQTDREGARRKADSLERAAHAKRERYRYDAHDGLDAGRLFGEASKCYEVAGDPAGKERVDGEGRAWRQRITEEFSAARLRLRTALQNGQLETALSAVVAMRRVLEGEATPYATWLAGKDRQLRTEINKTIKK